ncbi:MAG: cytochrome c [Crocinitomicaceae bacterium]|nr:cytochrome c [Crocinitomicaceae bacterium]MCF8433057.1 cytochrome c [Crocinitomicaceae bacterium]
MKMKFKAIASIAVVALSTLMLGSCTADADSSGLEYMPDMYRSPAIEPYVDYGEIRGRENTEAKMKISSLVPPSGTVPYYGKDSSTVALMLPYFRKASIAFRETHGMYGADLTVTDEYTAAASDMNPLKITAENSEELLKSGKTLYTAYCQHCHGEKGDGNGPMVLSGAYVGVPNYTERAAKSDGQLFYSIYYGLNAMGGHSSQLNKKEIWTLVHYVRKFQNASYGTFGASGEAIAAPVAVDSLSVKK